MQAAFAALLELEMLDRIGDEHLAAVDAGIDDRAVEHAACRTDERMALSVLLVARLLADQHDLGVPRPFSRHNLRRVAIERAAGAVSLRIAQGGKAADVGYVVHVRAMTAAADCSRFMRRARHARIA